MIRVLLVDDSALARRLLSRMLTQVEGFQIVGEASDAYVARDRIVELRPDVVILDLEMPRMDGISFLRKLMKHFPIPVVVCSSLTPEGGENALRALDAGAIAVVCKAPAVGAVPQMTVDLTTAVRAAALAGRGRERFQEEVREAARASIPAVAAAAAAPRAVEDCRLIAIGASTGGTLAVEAIVRELPADTPPIVIVQHLPQYISGAFARRLDQLTPLHVEEAVDGVVLRPGIAVVAPGDRHVVLERRGSDLFALVRTGDKVNGHRPSVDVLFRSAAEVVRADALGVLLTGMGRDGAEGLLAMRSAGARTIVQDEATSTVWGMPKAAMDLGAADEVIALDRIASRMCRLARPSTIRSARAPAAEGA
jgi:two-component system chemotaxis response regulator CheB